MAISVAMASFLNMTGSLYLSGGVAERTHEGGGKFIGHVTNISEAAISHPIPGQPDTADSVFIEAVSSIYGALTLSAYARATE
ncbi:hypothetical protein [Sphingomonas sp. BAUL-RG-20F-R05-02]|uniref:hypothetical protein n=1 Tax=Sphingomonas sp. BAUL-RG-20F-R05-02 TaxID=2914830 RepID=UPI001F59F5F3|nr:hypothetical protein [Sphingomonas sp. BAUL-RG-20F-R05-02]